jgi:ribosomal protein S18 acetylase RimI-like enzyme
MEIFKEWLSNLISYIQSLRYYRFFSHLFRIHLEIVEPGKLEMEHVREWLEIPEDEARVDDQPGMTNLIAKNRFGIIGYVELARNPDDHPTFPGYWLFSLATKPQFRRMGVGERMTLKVIDLATKEKAESLSLIVKSDNLKAVQLYEKLGFRKIRQPSLNNYLQNLEKSDSHKRSVMVRPFSTSRVTPGNS